MPDGIGVAIAAKWRGTPVKANLAPSPLSDFSKSKRLAELAEAGQ